MHEIVVNGKRIKLNASQIKKSDDGQISVFVKKEDLDDEMKANLGIEGEVQQKNVV